MARYTVYLRQDPEKGWEWWRHLTRPEEPDYRAPRWGWYKAKGHATAAAKRSLTRTIGGKIDPSQFEFIDVTEHEEDK